jgi:hypothetical protein
MTGDSPDSGGWRGLSIHPRVNREQGNCSYCNGAFQQRQELSPGLNRQPGNLIAEAFL